MNKAFKYIIILIFLSNCSSSKNEAVIDEKLIDIFKKNKPIEKEFNQELKIKKLNIFKRNPFFKNNSNNNGNINFESNFDKISTYKINKIKKFDSNQPELFFT